MNRVIAMLFILIFLTINSFCQSFQYDDLNRILYIEYEDGSYITYAYDLLGNRITKEVNPCTNFVANTNDTGTGSLRRAVECAMDGDTIFFSQDIINQTIILESVKIILDKNLVFKQAQNTPINIRSDFAGSVFEVETGKNVYIEYINLFSGSNSNGRAIENSGNLTLKDVMIYDDLIDSGSGATILNKANSTLTVEGNCNIKKQ